MLREIALVFYAPQVFELYSIIKVSKMWKERDRFLFGFFFRVALELQGVSFHDREVSLALVFVAFY